MQVWRDRILSYRQLTIGIVIIGAVVLLGLIGPLFVNVNNAKVGSDIPDLTPSVEHPLGTDTVGRDLLAVIIVGTPQTLSIGLIAGVIGLGVGTLFGFAGGYFGGYTDNLLRGAADVSIAKLGSETDLFLERFTRARNDLVTRTAAAYAQQQHPGKVQVGYLFPTFDRFGVYYRKGDSIGGKIAAAVTALRANGTLKRLAAKYKIPVGDVK